MGLITEVLLLPFAPVRGSVWVMRTGAGRRPSASTTTRATIRAELARLEQQLEAGEIDEEEFDRREDELLDRLEIARAEAREPGNGTTG